MFPVQLGDDGFGVVVGAGRGIPPGHDLAVVVSEACLSAVWLPAWPGRAGGHGIVLNRW
jgi:hypothetical protein